MGVLQSGTVSPGHLASWVTDGVIADGGAAPAANRVLASIQANMNDTGDQPLILPASVTAFQLTGIIVTNASISLTTAVGGVYPAAVKGGTAIVANTQVYSSLTSADLLLNLTLSAFAQSARFSSNNLGLVLNANSQYALAVYLSLTTPQGVDATADVFLTGIDLSQ